MKYDDLPTIENRMEFRLTCFLLENLAAQKAIDLMEGFQAHRVAAQQVRVVTRELPWLATRVDPQAHKSFGIRMSRRIICGDCGRAFGHKTWHSGTPNRADVWECPTNYAKRGTCATDHLYQQVLMVKMAEAVQVLAQRNSNAVERTIKVLRETGTRRRTTTLRDAIHEILAASPVNLVLHIPDFLDIFEGGCMLTDGRIGFVFLTGEAVTLELPHRWTPVHYADDAIAIGRC